MHVLNQMFEGIMSSGYPHDTYAESAPCQIYGDWREGVSIVSLFNEVNRHRAASLLLGCVTVGGQVNRLGM